MLTHGALVWSLLLICNWLMCRKRQGELAFVLAPRPLAAHEGADAFGKTLRPAETSRFGSSGGRHRVSANATSSACTADGSAHVAWRLRARAHGQDASSCAHAIPLGRHIARGIDLARTESRHIAALARGTLHVAIFSCSVCVPRHLELLSQGALQQRGGCDLQGRFRGIAECCSDPKL